MITNQQQDQIVNNMVVQWDMDWLNNLLNTTKKKH